MVPFYQPGEALLALARDPGNPRILYAAQKGGAAMSTDDGKSWSPIVGAPTKQRSIFVHPADRRQRWVGTEERGAHPRLGDHLP